MSVCDCSHIPGPNHQPWCLKLNQDNPRDRFDMTTNKSPFQQQYDWEREFAKSQPSGVKCQIDGCRGHVNWGWCSEHTPLHYKELP